MQRIRNSFLFFIAFFTSVSSFKLLASEGYELFYRESEAGAEPFINRMSVTSRYLRIDDMNEQPASGFMLFDAVSNTIYSISHLEKSILVMQPHDYEKPMLSDKLITTDKLMQDAPKIAGKQVYHYSVSLESDDISELCTSVQYVPGLLPSVGKVLQAWQQVLSANQVKILDRTPEEYRTPCMLSDQVYNRGDYYAKGIAIQEWHSSGKQRILQNFNKKQFDDDFFKLPEGYRQFTLDDPLPLQ